MPNRFFVLLAQPDSRENLTHGSLLDPGNSVLFIVMATGGLFCLLVTWIIFRAMRMSERSRELQHAERVKAIEAGQVWLDPVAPPEPSLGNRFWICFWIMVFGAAVPFMSISSSLRHIKDVRESMMLTAFISAGVVGATASICAAVIMCPSAQPASASEHDTVEKS